VAGIRLANIVIDCADVAGLASFWCAVTGYAPRPGQPPWDDPSWKAAKNRVHMDWVADDEEAEAARIQGLGATFLWRSSNPEDPFVTLADPEGNEFCVVRAAGG
jgi:hypothetical protein